MTGWLLKRSCMGSLFLLLLLPFPRTIMAAEYAFVTRWEIAAPLAEVWSVIYDVERWPQWWKGVEVQMLRDGDHTGTGAKVAFIWKAALPYKLHFSMTTVQVIRGERIDGKASGELEGVGTWLFHAANSDTTVIEYHWQVRTTSRWMNRLSFILKPVFRANHNVVMRRGERGLKRELAD